MILLNCKNVLNENCRECEEDNFCSYHHEIFIQKSKDEKLELQYQYIKDPLMKYVIVDMFDVLDSYFIRKSGKLLDFDKFVKEVKNYRCINCFKRIVDDNYVEYKSSLGILFACSKKCIQSPSEPSEASELNSSE